MNIMCDGQDFLWRTIMWRLHCLDILLVLILLITSSQATSKWSSLYPHGCRGNEQSPISIPHHRARYDVTLSDVQLVVPKLSDSRMVLIHNGKTIQVNTRGDYFLTSGGLSSTYRIVQFHLHWGSTDSYGSEHQIDDQSSPMELHILAYEAMKHWSIAEAMNEPNAIAMLGVLFELSDTDNPALEPIMDAVKIVQDPDIQDRKKLSHFLLNDLLPSDTSKYYRYTGSLTTPGCNEGVIWTVFHDKQYISHKQLRLLRSILRPTDSADENQQRTTISDNFRPIQPLNHRPILKSFRSQVEATQAQVRMAAKKAHHWDYKGSQGVDQWATLFPHACAGRHQSPINIEHDMATYKEMLSEFTISGSPVQESKFVLTNNGHTAQVTVKEGDYFVSGGNLGSVYKTAQFHFHWGAKDNHGSEHALDGHRFPLELHVVNYDSRRFRSLGSAVQEPHGLAVLAVFFELSDNDNNALKPIINKLSKVRHANSADEVPISQSFHLSKLLPHDTSKYYRYNGSLTTPGCFESVIWTIFQQTQRISSRQMQKFRSLLHPKPDGGDLTHSNPDGHMSAGGVGRHVASGASGGGHQAEEPLVDNFRPLQDLGDRSVWRSFDKTLSHKSTHKGQAHSWTYHGHNTGPKNWPKMYPNGCSGYAQSPINIVPADTVYSPLLTDIIIFDSPDEPMEKTLINNGHTVKAAITGGSYYMVAGGLPSQYRVAQFHFHWGRHDHSGSEHKVNGHAYPLEMHIVTYDSERFTSLAEAATQPEGLAVLGVFFSLSSEDNLDLKHVIEKMELIKDPEVSKEAVLPSFSLMDLLPSDTKSYYRYAGSLTTPGCYESVIWTIFKQTRSISAKQLNTFRGLLHAQPKLHKKRRSKTGHHHRGNILPSSGNNTARQHLPADHKYSTIVDNFRPTQELNNRTVWRSFVTIADGSEAAHDWSYDGQTGPNKWAELFPKKQCSGYHQSPVNIQRQSTTFDHNLRHFAIFYDPPLPGSRMTLINNGHTVQVNVDGDYYVTGGGLKHIYKTLQFHFHWGGSEDRGSEHQLDGVNFPLELHVVNYDSNTYYMPQDAVKKPGGLSVLGVLFQISEEDNPVFEKLVSLLSEVQNPDSHIEVDLPTISVKDLLPQDHTRYYRYNGSLTTPGCYESVIWTVFDDKQYISAKQLSKFREVLQKEHVTLSKGHITADSGYDTAHQGHKEEKNDKFRDILIDNFRPVQPLNGRKIYRSFKSFTSAPKTDSSHSNAVSIFSLSSICCVLMFTIICTLKHMYNI